MRVIVEELRRLVWSAIEEHMRRNHEGLVTGTVDAVDTSANLATVSVSGADAATTTVPWLNPGVTGAYVPAAGDEVYLQRTKSSLVILGKRA